MWQRQRGQDESNLLKVQLLLKHFLVMLCLQLSLRWSSCFRYEMLLSIRVPKHLPLLVFPPCSSAAVLQLTKSSTKICSRPYPQQGRSQSLGSSNSVSCREVQTSEEGSQIMWWFCVNNLCPVLQPYISLHSVWNKTSKNTLQKGKKKTLIIFTGLLECH